MIGAVSLLHAAEPKPETVAAFDKYVKLTEDDFAKHLAPGDFLWLDRHTQEKTLVWLGQSKFMALQTLDHGAPIEVPNGEIQHWLGLVYCEGMNAELTRGLITNYGGYKDFFRLEVIDTKVIKTAGDTVDFLLRLYKKQFGTLVLNVTESAKFTQLDPLRWTVAAHSTHIGEAEHPKNKKKLDEERDPEDAAGYLWRFNMYYRVVQADNGVYIELETISLGHQPSGLLTKPSRILNGFEDFPRDFTAYLTDVLDHIFPKPKRH